MRARGVSGGGVGASWQSRLTRAAVSRGIAVLAVVLVVSAVGARAVSTSRIGHRDHVRGAALPARLSVGAGSHRIRRGFFGLSIEPSELGSYERAGPVFDRFVALIRPRDGRTMQLRIGGTSADQAWWHTAGRRPPSGVFTIGEPWVAALARLVARDRLRVLLDVNLAVHSPRLAASFTTAVADAIPSGALAGVEVGNEPDLYFEQPWLEHQRIASTERSLAARLDARVLVAGLPPRLLALRARTQNSSCLVSSSELRRSRGRACSGSPRSRGCGGLIPLSCQLTSMRSRRAGHRGRSIVRPSGSCLPSDPQLALPAEWC